MQDGACQSSCAGKSLVVGSVLYCGSTCQDIATQSSTQVYLSGDGSTCSSTTCSGIYVSVNSQSYCGTSCIDIGTQSSVVVYLQGGTCVQACSGGTPNIQVTSTELMCVDCSSAGLLTYTGTLTYCAAACSMIASWASVSTMYVKDQAC